MNVTDFLEKQQVLFDDLGENDKALNEPYKNLLEQYLKKLQQICSVESFSVCDTITGLSFQNRHDTPYVDYLKKVDSIIENEQYPEVAQRKLMITSHMRNSSVIPDTAMAGVTFALNKLENYKGNDLKLFCPVIKMEIESLSSESPEFIAGANQAIEFFTSNYKAPVLSNSKLMISALEDEGAKFAKDLLEEYKCCDMKAVIEHIRSEVEGMNLEKNSKFISGAEQEISKFESNNRDLLIAQEQRRSTQSGLSI
ncbi:hypothetical protein LMH73_015665 [Vibrio splendidus]|nr:hypothetical protein [Vibrio splendidus]MCC4881474.1 hypothetical protein [Vibrio splendidus]